MYDLNTHNVTGDSLYLIKIDSFSYKVWIQKYVSYPLDSTKWVVRIAKWDNSTDNTLNLNRGVVAQGGAYTNRLFAYYDVYANTVRDREAGRDSFDMVFTRYIENIPQGPALVPYPVTGVLMNFGDSVSNLHSSDTALAHLFNHPFSNSLKAIGSSWKMYDMNLNMYVLDSNMGIHGKRHLRDRPTRRATGWPHRRGESMLAGPAHQDERGRLGVGMQGVAQAEAAYQAAADYVNDRLQGRSLDRALKNPDGPAEPIIVDPDVRRTPMDRRRPSGRPRVPFSGPPCTGDLCSTFRPTRPSARRPPTCSACSPRCQGLSDRPGLRRRVDASRCRRPAISANRAWSSSSASPHRPDLRRHQRHPGAGPGRPQARRKTAAARSGLLRRSSTTSSRRQGGRRELEAARHRPGRAAKADLQTATLWLMQNGLSNPNNAGARPISYMTLMGVVALA